jgi:hypothetical protein
MGISATSVPASAMPIQLAPAALPVRRWSAATTTMYGASRRNETATALLCGALGFC